MTKGIGGRHLPQSRTNEWLTPPWILKQLGIFDLDPCSPIKRPWKTAKKHYTIKNDGLKKPWFGRVWCNPPYGKETENWLKKMSEYGNGIALIFARTETKMFFNYVWEKASAILFIKGRLTFFDTNGNPGRGNSGGPSCLIAYGEENSKILEKCLIPGKFFKINA